LETGIEKEIPTIFQDPQFTHTDKQLLHDLGYSVVEDPAAFGHIGESSLVYAIHCYADVYKKVSEQKRPAVFIGTDVENFGRFNLCAFPSPSILKTILIITLQVRDGGRDGQSTRRNGQGLRINRFPANQT